MKDTDHLSPSEIIAWLEHQAAKLQAEAASLLQAANIVRQTGGISSGSKPLPFKPGLVPGSDTPASADAFKAILPKRSMRPADFAKHFNISVENVRGIINDPASGLEIGTRGWVKVKEAA